MDSSIKRDVDSAILKINRSQRKAVPFISCVAPCYNEANNIQRLCEEVDAVFKKIGTPYELILVNDGSQDDTMEIGRAHV